MLQPDSAMSAGTLKFQVPTLPEVALQIIRIAQQSDPDLRELIAVVRTDAAIAGRLVKYANSPLYGIRRQSETIDSAVILLGTNMVRTLVLGFSLARATVAEESLRPWFQQIWRESMFQACAAEVLGERHGKVDPAVWMLAGLLQDAGRLVMLDSWQEEYVEKVIEAKDDLTISEREQQAFGYSHEDVGGALCRGWFLDERFVYAVESHHRAPAARIGHDPDPALTSALHAGANCSDYMESVSVRLTSKRDLVERELIDQHNCRPDEVVPLLAEMDSRARELAIAMNVDIGRVVSRESLLERAQEALCDIAVAAQLRLLSKTDSKSFNDTLVGLPSAAEKNWLDPDSGTFSRRLLDRILPEQIASGAENDTTLGLLSVVIEGADLSEVGELARATADTIRACVRPDDRLIRSSDTQFVVVLNQLNMSLLARIAQRIMEQVSNVLKSVEGQARVGGLMVVPTGGRPPNAATVLSNLAKIQKSAAKSGREQLLLMHGRKLTAVRADSV